MVEAFAVVVLPFLTIRDHGLPTYLCCASTIVFPLSNPKCVTHLPASICLYITYKYSGVHVLLLLPMHLPIHRYDLVLNSFDQYLDYQGLAIILHLILPYSSMVYLSSFALLLFLHFLFLVLYIYSIFRLPSAITFCLTIPMYMYIYCCSWICPTP